MEPSSNDLVELEIALVDIMKKLARVGMYEQAVDVLRMAGDVKRRVELMADRHRENVVSIGPKIPMDEIPFERNG